MGEVEFPSQNDAFSDATLIVTVQDTQEADAPARVLCKQDFRNISRLRDSSDSLRFAFECEDIPKNPFVIVNVLVDLDGDGCVSRGDYINTEFCPVQFSPNEMRIRVRRVR